MSIPHSKIPLDFIPKKLYISDFMLLLLLLLPALVLTRPNKLSIKHSSCSHPMTLYSCCRLKKADRSASRQHCSISGKNFRFCSVLLLFAPLSSLVGCWFACLFHTGQMLAHLPALPGSNKQKRLLQHKNFSSAKANKVKHKHTNTHSSDE